MDVGDMLVLDHRGCPGNGCKTIAVNNNNEKSAQRDANIARWP